MNITIRIVKSYYKITQFNKVRVFKCLLHVPKHQPDMHVLYRF